MWSSFFRGDGGEDLAGEAGPAANVEDEGGRGKVKKGEGAMGHLGLDVLDAGRSGVFLGFEVVVVEIWGEDIFWAGHGGRIGGKWVGFGFGILFFVG